jgi:hypothetical protein
LNLKKFFTSGPINLFAIIDMTFPDRPSAAEASKRFHSFWTNILSPHFDQYIRILEGHTDGSPHYHIAARTRGLDIRSGFNFQLHEELKKISARSDIPASEKQKLRNQLRRFLGDLGRSEALIEIHRAVETSRRSYGVGRTQIAPVRTNPEAVSRYLAKNLLKETVLNLDGRKNRIVTYSRGFQKAASARFNFNSGGSRLWRQKVKAFAAFHGCSDSNQLKEKFGPRWAWTCREAIVSWPPSA